MKIEYVAEEQEIEIILPTEPSESDVWDLNETKVQRLARIGGEVNE